MTDPTPFEDHFSSGAQDYLHHRPTYPGELFEHLAATAPGRLRALDCATGSGQAAVALAEHFDEVIATDGSQAQLDHALQHPRVQYRRALAEASGVEAASVDVITAAAAAHWFDLDRFYAEVRRVARPSAILALWTYDGRPQVHPEVEAQVARVRDDLASVDWPPGFDAVRDGYRSLSFPFERIETPDFEARATWTVDRFLGHLRSWSSVQRQTRRTGRDPVQEVEAELRAAWGAPDELRVIRWPLFVRIGRVEVG